MPQDRDQVGGNFDNVRREYLYSAVGFTVATTLYVWFGMSFLGERVFLIGPIGAVFFATLAITSWISYFRRLSVEQSDTLILRTLGRLLLAPFALIAIAVLIAGLFYGFAWLSGIPSWAAVIIVLLSLGLRLIGWKCPSAPRFRCASCATKPAIRLRRADNLGLRPQRGQRRRRPLCGRSSSKSLSSSDQPRPQAFAISSGDPASFRRSLLRCCEATAGEQPSAVRRPPAERTARPLGEREEKLLLLRGQLARVEGRRRREVLNDPAQGVASSIN